MNFDSNTTALAKSGGDSLKFLFFPLSYVLAHSVRMLDIAKELRKMGHEVVFASAPSSTPGSKSFVCERNGFRVIPRADVDWPWLWKRFLKYGFGTTLWDLFRHQKWAPLDAAMEEQIAIIRKEEPDMVVGDGTFCLSSAAHVTGVPMAGILNNYATRFYRSFTPNRAVISLWNRLFLEPLRRPVYARHGCEPVDALELLRRVPLISPDIPELCSDTPEWPNWETVGPIVWQPEMDCPEWLNKIDDGRKNVYITMGSTGALDPFLRKCYAALGASPYRFIVTTADQVTRETVEMAPDNFIIEEYLPGAEVLKHCQALIFHGGNGSMYQGLEAGVPMIAVPFHFEQRVNAKNCVQYGFGVHIPPRKVSGKRILKALDTLLADPSYRRASKKLSASVKRSRGAQRAAEIFVETALASELVRQPQRVAQG